MKLNALQAVAEGRKLAASIAGKLAAENIPAQDGCVSLVFAKRDNLGKVSDPVEVIKHPSDFETSEDLEAARRHLLDVPIGFVVTVLDRAKRKLIGHARPLIVSDPKALELMAAELEKATDTSDARAD